MVLDVWCASVACSGACCVLRVLFEWRYAPLCRYCVYVCMASAYACARGCVLCTCACVLCVCVVHVRVQCADTNLESNNLLRSRTVLARALCCLCFCALGLEIGVVLSVVECSAVGVGAGCVAAGVGVGVGVGFGVGVGVTGAVAAGSGSVVVVVVASAAAVIVVAAVFEPRVVGSSFGGDVRECVCWVGFDICSCGDKGAEGVCCCFCFFFRFCVVEKALLRCANVETCTGDTTGVGSEAGALGGEYCVIGDCVLGSSYTSG